MSKAAVLFMIMPGVYDDYTPIAPIGLTGLPLEKIQEVSEVLIIEDVSLKLDVPRTAFKVTWIEPDAGVIQFEDQSYGFNVRYHQI